MSVCLAVRREPTRAEAEEAAERLWAEADSGSAAALYNLAAIYDRGFLPSPIDSVSGDTITPRSLYQRAAEKGYIPAVSHYGYLLVRDAESQADIDSGMRLIEKAALAGDPKAANNLGYFLTQGELVTRDYEKALFWLKKAADAGLATGAAQLADLYRQGLGTTPDTLAATALYEQAIHAGLADAQRKLIAMNARGWQSLSPDSALTLARRYYREGVTTPAIILLEQITNHYRNTPASRENYSTSAGKESYSTSAAQESYSTSVKAHALALLGDAYSRGIGVPYSYEKSIELFLRAARLGNAPAQFIVAETLDMFPDALDEFISRTSAEHSAVYWYDRASASGIEEATAAYRLLLQ